jgi:hypothetical protein
MFTPLKQSKTYTVFFEGHLLVLTDEHHHQICRHQVSPAPLVLLLTTIGAVPQDELAVQIYKPQGASRDDIKDTKIGRGSVYNLSINLCFS